MPECRNGMGSSLVVTHGKVFLKNIKTRTQIADDLSRRHDQQLVEDVDGFGIERL